MGCACIKTQKKYLRNSPLNLYVAVRSGRNLAACVSSMTKSAAINLLLMGSGLFVVPGSISVVSYRIYARGCKRILISVASSSFRFDNYSIAVVIFGQLII